MEKLSPIGTIELIALPGQHIEAVPAKIDTGADSSAMWASHITEHQGNLTFVLFDTSSRFYTGNVISTKDYSRTAIKNSFGATETRYKVTLLIELGGRRIRAKFTLANRAANRYPVLIGRKTLHGKFLVDVTRKQSKPAHRVLMLSTKRTAPTQKYADNIARSGTKLEVYYASYEDLDYAIGQPKNLITVRETGEDIANFDLVYFKTTAKYMDVAAATARYLEKRKLPFTDEAIKHYPGTSKLYQYMLLEHSSLVVPPSLFMMPVPMAASFDTLAAYLGLPFVLKDIHGNKGEHNYVVTDRASFEAACGLAGQDNVQCVAQAFVPNDCDYRVLVLGRRVMLVIKRSRTDSSTHLNNTSQGAKAEIVDPQSLPTAIRVACVEAAKLVERQIAGVDIVQDKNTGMWYCLEVNDGPQLATGSFIAEKHAVVAAYLERKLA